MCACLLACVCAFVLVCKYCLDRVIRGLNFWWNQLGLPRGPKKLFLCPNDWLEPKEAITYYDVYHFFSILLCFFFTTLYVDDLTISQSQKYFTTMVEIGNCKLSFKVDKWIIFMASQINQLAVRRFCFTWLLFLQWGIPITIMGLANEASKPSLFWRNASVISFQQSCGKMYKQKCKIVLCYWQTCTRVCLTFRRI